MSFLFNEILYRPIFNFLVLIYNFLPGSDFGIAIVVLTLVMRSIFFPFSIKTIVSQKKLTGLQPKIKEIQNKNKHDKAAQAQAMMELYKREGVNPMSGCLPLIIQLPVLFALYKALADGFRPETLGVLYNFVENPQVINNFSLGFFDLAKKSSILAVSAGLFQFIQSRLSLKFQKTQGQEIPPNFNIMNKQMLYFFPVMIIIISWNLPAGLVLYWAITTLFSIFEQVYIGKYRN